jgi:hypothetical protein
MVRVVESDTNALTLRLAGTFEPTEELFREADRAQQLNVRLFNRLRKAGVIRGDAVVDDLAFLLEQLAALRLPDRERTMQLRRRYLALQLDGLRPDAGPSLPGPPPTWKEIGERWVS